MTTEKLASDLLAIIDSEMYVNDFGGLQAGRDATTDIHAAMAKLQASLAQRQPLTDEQIETIIQTKHFSPLYVKRNSDLVILDWYRLGLRDGEAAHGIGKKT
jgi:hypothetical protein